MMEMMKCSLKLYELQRKHCRGSTAEEALQRKHCNSPSVPSDKWGVVLFLSVIRFLAQLSLVSSHNLTGQVFITVML